MVSPEFKITYDDAKHLYTLDGNKVPSVTTILDAVTSKPALTWWGMRVGMAAVVHAMQTHGWAELANANGVDAIVAGVPEVGREYFQPGRRNAKAKTLVEMLCIDQKRSTNHVKDEAAERGTLIHNAMEQLGLGMDVSEVQDLVPDEHAGYVAGLCNWWLDHQPVFLEQEIIVASREHQYAGRFDAVVRYEGGPHKGRIVLSDLKTSKRVYTSHLVQLDAYAIAYAEMGLEPPDWRDPLLSHDAGVTWPGFDANHVVNVRADGTYVLVESKLPPGHFVSYVNQFQSLALEKALHKELT